MTLHDSQCPPHSLHLASNHIISHMLPLHNPVMCSNQWEFILFFMRIFMNLLTFSKTLNSFFLLFLFSRGRLPQLPPHIPLRLRHKWVWLQAQPHHRLYRPHVLHGFGQGPQEGVEGNYPGSRAENGRQQLQKWLSRTPATNSDTDASNRDRT